MGDVDIEKVLLSEKTSFTEKNYKCFIGYLYDNQKVKPLHIMLPKTSAFVKSYDGQTKWVYFLTGFDNLITNIIIFEIKSVLISKKDFDRGSVYNKIYLETKISWQWSYRFSQ